MSTNNWPILQSNNGVDFAFFCSDRGLRSAPPVLSRIFWMSGKGPFGQDYLTRKKFVNNASYNYKKGDFPPGDTNDCESETGSSQESVEIIGEVQAKSKLKNKSTMKKVFSDSSVSEDITPAKKKEKDRKHERMCFILFYDIL